MMLKGDDLKNILAHEDVQFELWKTRAKFAGLDLSDKSEHDLRLGFRTIGLIELAEARFFAGLNPITAEPH